ncbi:MAG: PdxA family protein, partial [Caldimicrobium sp.]
MIKLGITLGDPAGVGPEILVKSLPYLEHLKAKFILFGDKNLILTLTKTYKINIPKNIELLNLSSLHIIPGRPNELTHRATVNYLYSAIDFLKKNEIQGLITLPISKECFKVLELPYRGHTEFLAEAFNIKNYAMCFYGKKLKVALVTTHIPLKEVPYKIDPHIIEKKAKLIYEFLKKIQTKKEVPKIALCALNPHAGEGGLLGNEEKEILIPIV